MADRETTGTFTQCKHFGKIASLLCWCVLYVRIELRQRPTAAVRDPGVDGSQSTPTTASADANTASTNTNNKPTTKSDEKKDAGAVVYGSAEWKDYGLLLLRFVLIAVLFTVMHHYFSKWILDPIFRPGLVVDKEARRQQIMSKICPPGGYVLRSPLSVLLCSPALVFSCSRVHHRFPFLCVRTVSAITSYRTTSNH